MLNKLTEWIISRFCASGIFKNMGMQDDPSARILDQTNTQYDDCDEELWSNSAGARFVLIFFWHSNDKMNSSRLLFKTNVTKVISINVLVKSSEKTLFFYLYFTWLCGSWKLKRILKNKPFWKYDSWFSSEVANFTSVRNMLVLSLKYWFMKAKVVFWVCYCPIW